MTPFSAPGAGAGAKPPAATPRAQGPWPMTRPYGNLASAVRVAPSPAPRAQAPGVPIARPRMPSAPHATQAAPIAGAPRPMVNHPGGAPMSGPSPTPRLQAVPQRARAPGIPPNTRAVGAAVPSARPQPQMPLLRPTQRAPAAANPAAPSLAKREATTMGPGPIQQAKRHAPMPRPQGAATGSVPLPSNPAAPAVGVRAPVPPGHAQGMRTAAPSRPQPSEPPKLGVYQHPIKGWMARVIDPKKRAVRDIGPFEAAHLAALAQDRVAVACAGRGIGAGARLNFGTAFYRVETAFLQRWEGDVCEAVETGGYDKSYAKYLKAGYRAALNIKPAGDGGEQTTAGDEDDDGQLTNGDEGDESIAGCYDAELFWDTIVDFFINRPEEIGSMALGKGGRLLRNRFVEMHRNKALCPLWRRDHQLKKMMLQKQQREKIQMQQQHQQIQMQQGQHQQIQMQQQHQQIQMKQGQHQQQHQQIQMQQPQQKQTQMKQGQHQQQQQHTQMQQQQRHRQQQFQQHQMMIQNQRQQQMMVAAQQQKQHLDEDATATLQVKQELS